MRIGFLLSISWRAFRGQKGSRTKVIEVTDFKYDVGFDPPGCLEAVVAVHGYTLRSNIHNSTCINSLASIFASEDTKTALRSNMRMDMHAIEVTDF